MRQHAAKRIRRTDDLFKHRRLVDFFLQGNIFLVELVFQRLNLLKRPLCRGDVHHCPDKHECVQIICYGMSHDMDMLDRSIGH